MLFEYDYGLAITKLITIIEQTNFYVILFVQSRSVN